MPTRDKRDVVLVIIGALGDLCIRRVLKQARRFAKDNRTPLVQDVILIDRHPQEHIDLWIARRLIEQKIEEKDRDRVLDGVLKDKKVKSWLATGDPVVPDPTDHKMTIDEAYDHLRVDFGFTAVDIKGLKTGLAYASTWAEGLLKDTAFGETVPRYWQSITQDSLTFIAKGRKNEITGTEVRALSQKYRVILYVATPPQAYLGIIKQWGEYADRIALEKPLCGLLEEEDGIIKLAGEETTIHSEINDLIRRTARKRADRNLAPLEVVTIDHYNSKWILLAIDVWKGRHLLEHILKRPIRILVEVCETELLPRGRFYFYNTVGGAFADMAPHLLQLLRAISPYASAGEMLENLHVVDVKRAQYKIDHDPSAVRPDRYRGKYFKDAAISNLLEDTETFAEILLKFISGDWINVNVILRTGKGIHPRSKILRVYGPDEGEGYLTATFNIENDEIRLGLERDGKVVEEYSQNMPISIKSGNREHKQDTPEYEEVFADLCAWQIPDPRYFPPVREAAKVCEFVRKALVKERHRGKMELPSYAPYGKRPNVDPSKQVLQNVAVPHAAPAPEGDVAELAAQGGRLEPLKRFWRWLIG